MCGKSGFSIGPYLYTYIDVVRSSIAFFSEIFQGGKNSPTATSPSTDSNVTRTRWYTLRTSWKKRYPPLQQTISKSILVRLWRQRYRWKEHFKIFQAVGGDENSDLTLRNVDGWMITHHSIAFVAAQMRRSPILGSPTIVSV